MKSRYFVSTIFSILTLCFSSFYNFSVSAKEFTFRHILTQNGDPVKHTRHIVKDNQGYLWLSGDQGILRYDGFEFFRINKEPTSNIFLAKDGGFWSSGTGILTKVSKETYSNEYFPILNEKSGYPHSNMTYDMTVLNNRQLFATQMGVSEYLDEQNSFVHYQLKTKKASTGIIGATQLLLTGEKEILIGTTQGLYINSLPVVKNNTILLNQLLISNSQITQIIKSSDGGLLVGSNNGLYILNKSYEIVNHFPCLKVAPCNSPIQITKLLVDIENKLWIGTGNGLYILELESLKVIHLKHSRKNPKSISNNLITDLHLDELGNVLISTYSGLDYFNRNSIHLTNKLLINDQSADVNNVWSIHRDNANQLWLGTFRSGLYQFTNTETRQFNVDINHENSLSSNNIPLLFSDYRGNLWVGTTKGLQKYNPNTNKFINYPIGEDEETNQLNQVILVITEDFKKNLWIGTQAGFAKFNPDTGNAVTYNVKNFPDLKMNQWVRSILPITNNKLLIGTDLGLHVFDSLTNKIESMGETSYVYKIMKDSRNDIWILADEALYLFDRETFSLRKVSSLTPSSCLAMVEDNHLQLWMVCDMGIRVFDLIKRQFVKQLYFQSEIDINDFLTGSSSLIKDSNGEILLGMQGGLYSWMPFLYQKNEQNSDPAITRVIYSYKDGVERTESINGFLENRNIKNIDPLSYKLQGIKFHFSSLGIPHSNSSKFEYRLLGYNDSWVTAEKNNLKAVYENLDANEYTFQVRAKFPESEWQMASIRFTIMTKPWLSWWAYCLYLVLGIIFIYLSVNFYTRRLISKKAELEQIIVDRTKELAVNKMNVENLMQEKEQLIEDIYHQTKTPLQLMLGYLDFLNTDQLSLKQYTKKQTAEILKLSQLTEQALTISREDKLLDEVDNLYNIKSLIKPLLLSYSDITRARSLRFICHIEDPIFTRCYPKKIEHLVENLLSNAVKYTLQGFVELTIKSTGQFYNIICRDSGIGIAKVDKNKIFSRHIRAANAVGFEGAGIGLAAVKKIVEQHNGSIHLASELDKGSCFSVTLPIKLSAFENSQKMPTKNNNEEKRHLSIDSMGETSSTDTYPLVLIVEDNIELATYLKILLETKFRVMNALSAEEGLLKALERVPDLIISDVMMGQMNGYQFCQKVRSNPITCHIPLLLLTAKSDPVSQSKGYSVGANDYITKPVDQEVLISRINNQLDHIKNIRASIIKQHDITSSLTKDKLITRFFHYIEANFSNSELLIKDVSVELHVSTRQLERKIRYFIDMTPNEYLNEYRLLRARELLLAGKSIHEIFDSCGFSSHAYFSQRYKQRFSKTPSTEQKKTTLN